MKNLSLNYVAIILSMISVASYAKEKVILPNASYFIFEGQSQFEAGGSGFISSSWPQKFYTFDGNLLKTVKKSYNNNSCKMCTDSEVIDLLDPTAPRPQPLYYRIKRFSPKPLYILSAFFSSDFIIFYDKHDNAIASYCYNKKNKQITTVATIDGKSTERIYHLPINNLRNDLTFPLDLSICKKMN